MNTERYKKKIENKKVKTAIGDRKMRMRRYTTMEKGKQQLMNTDANQLMLNLEYIWLETYTGLIMEQIRNSQEDNKVPASYQVIKLYIHVQFT